MSQLPALQTLYKSIFTRKTEFIIPRITKSIAKDHLFNAVKNYAKFTGQEVGVIITNEGILPLSESSLSKTTSENTDEKLSG